MQKNLKKTVNFLKKSKNILLITTSNRWVGEKEDIPKSSQIALKIKKELGNRANLIDATKLNICPCEGNVSTKNGNTCGLKEAVLKDKKKNPSGEHRCWASINNKDDELWRISESLIKSDTVVFFTSVRWGSANSIYQKLIERLTWLENRHSTLGEKNILKKKSAGIIIIGQNWEGREVLKTQKKVLSFYGFNVKDELCWNWQYSKNPKDETNESYINSSIKFKKIFID